MSDQDLAFFFSGQAHVYYGAILIILLAVGGVLSSRGQMGLLLAFILIAIMAAGIFVDVWANGYRH